MPRLTMMPADLGMPSQYNNVGFVTTGMLDLGAAPRERPIMIHLVWTGPVGTNVQASRARDSADGVVWGAWQSVAADQATPFTPRRYLQVEIQLSTSDTLQTPVLTEFGIYD